MEFNSRDQAEAILARTQAELRDLRHEHGKMLRAAEVLAERESRLLETEARAEADLGLAVERERTLPPGYAEQARANAARLLSGSSRSR